MAINRKWGLGLLAAACLGGAAVVLSQPAQPDLCPEDGCRVGYRFEDGGIAPEGWEPYVTDDPVVALMDACLTYFMTGDVADFAIVRQDRGDDGLLLGVPLTPETILIRNAPPVGPYGTFSCLQKFTHSNESIWAVQSWLTHRFQDSELWHEGRNDGAFSARTDWSVSYTSEALAGRATVGYRDSWRVYGPKEAGPLEMELFFRLSARYHGPIEDFLATGLPDITF